MERRIKREIAIDAIRVIEIWSWSDDEEGGSSPRSILCLKRNVDNMKEIEEEEDCFILDFDPYESINPPTDDDNDAGELSVIAERGQVACRDYPHSRHLCVKFPFDRTLHESYCEQCYCYVCDSTAPCESWTDHQTETGHCHATDCIYQWMSLRKSKNQVRPLPFGTIGVSSFEF